MTENIHAQNSTALSFSALGVPNSLVESLERMHIKTPTPIQEKSIAPAIAGRDILASAQTGTGKTISYLIPLVLHLLKSNDAKALVLAPTRELAAQVKEGLQALLGQGSALSAVLLIGGEPISKQFFSLKKNPRVIIGTPGRIIDHLDRKTLNLSKATFLVLDETDRMLDMGFTEPLKKIVGHLVETRQTLMFSATMPPSIVNLSQKYLTDPLRISVGSTTQAKSEIQQDTIKLSASGKFTHLLKELDERTGSVIVFVKTKRGAEQLADKLKIQNHSADAMHGDLRQNKRDQIVKAFRNQKNRIMVATDVAARGIDIPHVMHVINYDLPQCPEDYIHRIGRTGRAGSKGFALSMISPEDNDKWRAIHRLMSGEILEGPRMAPSKSRSRSNNGPRSNGPGAARSNAGAPRKFGASGGGKPWIKSDQSSARPSSFVKRAKAN
ncbi:MAG: DEAD/DEAH box helicase [Pseudomonadota bacterium]